MADQGVVTVEDVMNYFGCWKRCDSVRMTMSNLGIEHQKYGGIKYGIWFIKDRSLFELLRKYYPGLQRYKVRGENLLFKVPHSFGMNYLRTVLERSDKIVIVEWWSEEFIRSLPVYKRDGLTAHKVPDAIFWRKRKDETRQKFFLEYERSMKAPVRYGRILQFYAKRHDVENKNVIYICETDQIRNKLIKIEQELVKGGKLKATGLFFNFITMDEFNQAYSSKKEIRP